jgi:hypothetical protein
MCAREQPSSLRLAVTALVAALAFFLIAMPSSAQASSGGIPTPCDLPGVGFVCDAVGQTAKDVIGATAELIMRGITSWVTDAAVWVTGKVGALIDATASPNVQADWFQGQYRSMLTVAGALALPMLLLALTQAILRQDIWILARSAFGYLPIAFILAAAAIVATQLIITITDDLARVVATGTGGASSNLLQSVGDAYTQALDDRSNDAVPLFGIFLGAIILAIGAFVLWLEMIIRDAAIYIALFFLPLTFVAMIWPATSRWARRLVELLIAVILAKFVIVSIISLATAAITNTTFADSGGGAVFERMIAGSALLVLAAWSPFALLRLIPMMEVAAASVTGQRAAMASAAGSAGIQTPAAYMRQTMDRHSRASTSPPSSGAPRAAYAGGGAAAGAASSAASAPSAGQPSGSGASVDAPSAHAGRTTYTPPRRGSEATSSVGTATAVETRRERVSSEEHPAGPPSPSTGGSAPRPRPAREAAEPPPPSSPGTSPRPAPPPDRPRSPRPSQDKD